MARLISSKHVVTTSFLVDLSDLVLNVAVAILTGSVIMLAEALQGAADLTTSSLLLLGLRQSNKRPNRRHPFGYGRELYFWTFIAALGMLSVTATLSIYSAWQRFLQPVPLNSPWLAFVVLAFGLVTNSYAFGLSVRRLREQDSKHALWHSLMFSDLIETKTTFVLDAMGALAALFGLINLIAYSMTGDARFDAIGGILIGITIAVFAGFLVIQIKDLLVGRSALPEVEESIKQAALEIKGVKGVITLRTMTIGSQRLLVDMEVDMQANLTTNALEQLIEKIKTKVKERVPSVRHIHVELATDVG